MQQLQPQSNVSGLHQHSLLGTQPGNAGVETNQHYSHKVPGPQTNQQQSKVSKPKKGQHKSKVPEQQNELSQNQLSQQQASQQQMATHIQLQSVPQQLNSLQRELQQRIPTSGSSLQNQLFQSQSVDPEASSYLTAQTSNVNGEDWLKVYQKIKSMNDMYLLDLKDNLVKMTNFLIKYGSQPQRSRNERVENIRHNTITLEHIVKLLQMSNTDIQRTYRNWDELLALEANIKNFIAVRKGRTLQPQVVNVQHELPQTQMASQDNQMNSQMQPTDLQIQLEGAHINASTTVSSESNIERLIKAVEEISHASLRTAVADIRSIVSMGDGMAGSAQGNLCRATVGENLDNCRGQARTFLTPNRTFGTKRARQSTTVMPSDDRVNQLNSTDGFELESTAASSFKRPWNEPNHALIKEIAEINQRLIDTEVEIIDEGVVQTAAKGGDGIIVKCSYKAVALSPTLKYKLTSAWMCPIQPLILRIPTDYPNSSPTPLHLDKSPAAVSGEYENLSMKVKSKFNIFLSSISQPVSLSKVARIWDDCVRAIVSEFAQQRGGGTFSTKYE